MLIAGCSHTAGSEIDGNMDSLSNRQNSYGNQLAKRLGYRPINIAICGFTNSGIARSVLDWFHSVDYSNLEVFTLIGWSDSIRIEAAFEFPTWYNEGSAKYADWFSPSHSDFLQINLHNKSNFNERERQTQNDYRVFAVKRPEYMEITSVNLVLQMQYFLKSVGSTYLMTNTGGMFTKEYNKYLQHYFKFIDASRYHKFDQFEEAFYPKYKNLGYKNPLAQYGHHNLEVHTLYMEQLYNFIMENKT